MKEAQTKSQYGIHLALFEALDFFSNVENFKSQNEPGAKFVGKAASLSPAVLDLMILLAPTWIPSLLPALLPFRGQSSYSPAYTPQLCQRHGPLRGPQNPL